MLTDHSDDPVLPLLIELATTSLLENRPLFPNPLHEPVFYRRDFRRWVENGLEELAAIEKAKKEAARAAADPQG
jgi:hypothetical protein